MKKVLILLLLLINITLCAQRNVTVLSDVKIGSVTLEYKQKIYTDTTQWLRLSFQDKDYSMEERILFLEYANNVTISKLKDQLEWGIKNVKVIDDSRGIVYVYKIRNRIHLFIGNGYTTITIKQATSLLEWLEGIEIPEEYIPQHLKSSAMSN